MLWGISVNYGLNINPGILNTSFYKKQSDYTRFLTEINAHIAGQAFNTFPEDYSLTNIRVEGMLANINQGDTLIIQFPVYVNPQIFKLMADFVHNQRDGKVIGIFHEFEGLKTSELATSPENQQDSWNSFNLGTYDVIPEIFDALIVQSAAFKRGLQRRLNYDKPIIVQGPYGYKLYNDFYLKNRTFSKRINLVDNLDSTNYLIDAPASWELDVYGPGLNSALKERFEKEANFNYYGEVDPVEIASKLKDGFGLVWESSRYDTVDGPESNYLKYRYPHKLSLYLAANLPIIIWNKAAAADWVVKNDLGFAVANLSDIQPLLEALTEEQYQKYQRSLSKISPLIREGIFEKEAAIKAYRAVNQEDYQADF